MKLSIVIPAHNEESRIGKMLDVYLPFFSERYGNDVEFLVVVNGSTDLTEQVAAERISRYPILRQIVEPNPIGKGGALIRGFEAALGERIGFVDADGATLPEAFQDLVDRMGDADVMIASRWCKGAKVSPRQPLHRRVASRGFNLITRILFGLRLTDTQCGAKLMRREVLKKVIPLLGITQWAFDVDLLFQLRRAGSTIREIPTTWHDVAGSKISGVAKTAFDMFLALGRLRLVHSPFRWIVTLYDRYLTPLIRPEGVKEDYLIRHSLVLMASSQVANVLNLVLQAVLLRLLTGIEFGVMMSMLGVIAILGTPVGAMSRAVAHFTATLTSEGKHDRIVPMLTRAIRDVSLVGIPLLIMGVIFRTQIAAFFQLSSTGPIIITAVALSMMLYSPVLTGALHGRQAFFWYSGISIGGAFVRIILTVVLVVLGFGANGALAGFAGSILFALILGAVAIYYIVSGMRHVPESIPGFYRYFALFFVAIVSYMVLVMADVVCVKHYFTPEAADRFARATVMARMVVFLPQPIAMAMFPKVTSSGDTSYASSRTLLKALVLTLLLVVGVATACTAFPRLIIRVLTGEVSEDLVPLVRGMAWALSPVSVAAVLMNFELAQRRVAAVVPLVLSACLYLGAVAVWHGSLTHIVIIVGSCGTLALLVLSLMIWSRARNVRA